MTKSKMRKIPFLASAHDVIDLVRMGRLDRSSARPHANEFALVTKDIHGRVCVGAVGARHNMRENYPEAWENTIGK